MLTVSKDSIQSLLDKEREAHSSSKTTLTNQIDVLNYENNDLKNKGETQNARIANLESQLKKLETQLQVKEQEIFTQKNTIDNLNSELKNKSDSLLMLEAELLTYKPKPAPKKPEEVEDIKSGFKTVTIGSQTWMAENLNVCTFRNGDPIPQAKTDEEWEKAAQEGRPAWCYYDNDPANGKKYGKLYNWYAVNDSRGLAPVGYRVPSDAEWTVLTDYLGEEDASKKMKSKSGWSSYGCKKCDGGSYEFKKICSACKGTQKNSSEPFSGNGSNSSGFNGLPGGYRFNYHHLVSFENIGFEGLWWGARENSTDLPLTRDLNYDSDVVSLHSHLGGKGSGFSVRCLKD